MRTPLAIAACLLAMAFVFDPRGLPHNLALEGSRITRLAR
jgi:hypothetical protein